MGVAVKGFCHAGDVVPGDRCAPGVLFYAWMAAELSVPDEPVLVDLCGCRYGGDGGYGLYGELAGDTGGGCESDKEFTGGMTSPHWLALLISVAPVRNKPSRIGWSFQDRPLARPLALLGGVTVRPLGGVDH